MLIDIATSLPPYKITQEKIADILKEVMADNKGSSRTIDMAAKYSGIKQRYFVVSGNEEDSDFYIRGGRTIEPSTGKRMSEYEKWSKLLVKNAVTNLLGKNHFDPNKIDKLITISCTGFFAPGLDYYLINEFNLPLNVRRINIGFMGCAASIVGINSVFESVNKSENSSHNILLVSVELCSLHLHFNASKDNILANIIFADGCAAALFSQYPDPVLYKKLNSKLDIIDVKSILFKNSSELMGWKIGSYGFEMSLSSELPKIILNEAAPELINILNRKGLNIQQIKYWALHPGGRAILDSLQKGLNLSDEQMNASRNILLNYGNMSSPSILFVLKEILENNNIKKDELCCAVAFGPGLTMEIALFKGV